MPKISRHDGKDLRRILLGMVTNSSVCARIASQWKPEGLFDSPWANLIGNWCVSHVEEYGEPPERNIQSLFDSWSRKSTSDEKTIEAVERFLIHLSDEYDPDERQNSEYLLDLAGNYFNRAKLKRTMERASDDLERDDVPKAHERLVNIERVELGEGCMVKPAEDFSLWREAFDTERAKSLIPYPGAMNDFIGRWMQRECLIAFMGPDKTGKSTWLMDAGFRAIRNRCRVVHFDMGDMSRNQVLKRLGQRAARSSLYQQSLTIPKSIDSEGSVLSKGRSDEERLSPQKAFKAFKRVCRGRDCFRLACYPNDSMDIVGLSAVLMDWKRQGWVPDVVVIDYADILAAPPTIKETLDQIDTTWKRLRRIAQEFHCLVLTATQSNAAAYGAKGLLTRKHFSGRKTKLAHPDGVIGINVSPEDRDEGRARLNWVVRREGGFSERQFVWVAGCYDIFNPSMKSVR